MHCDRRVRSTDLPHNANGAGIAADPTLTSAWIPCSLRDFWRTFRLAEFRAYLAPDVWLCSPNLAIGVLRLAHQSFVTGARTGIRLSLLPCCVCPSPKAPVFAAMRSYLAETASLCRSGLAAFQACAILATRSGQITRPVR